MKLFELKQVPNTRMLVEYNPDGLTISIERERPCDYGAPTGGQVQTNSIHVAWASAHRLQQVLEKACTETNRAKAEKLRLKATKLMEQAADLHEQADEILKKREDLF